MLMRRHYISFKAAFEGLFYTIKTQPNLRIHFTIGTLVVLAGLIFGLSSLEWVAIVFTILWVIVSEMINTSVESIVDLVTKEYQIEAKVAKDVAAGMVLVGAFGSIVVGLIIFLPHITKFFKG